MSSKQRKLLSVVFTDVVGSTAFGSDNDPEAVQSVMASQFERMKATAELHGGTSRMFRNDVAAELDRSLGDRQDDGAGSVISN